MLAERDSDIREQGNSRVCHYLSEDGKAADKE